MIDRNRVVSRGVEVGEPTLTEGMLVDAANTMSYFFGPPSWWQFCDFANTAARAWEYPKKKDRHAEQSMILDFAQSWASVRQGGYDPEKAKKSAHRHASLDRKGRSYGPLVFRVGLNILNNREHLAAKGKSLHLTVHAQVAMVEAATVTLHCLDSGTFPASPPNAEEVRAGRGWLKENWKTVEKDSLAFEVSHSPWWWFDLWSQKTAPDAAIIAKHSSLVFMCGLLSPDFRVGWPQMLADLREAERLEAVREYEENKRRAQEYAAARRNDPPEGTFSGSSGIQTIHGTTIRGGVIQPTIYGTFNQVKHDGSQWWLPTGPRPFF